MDITVEMDTGPLVAALDGWVDAVERATLAGLKAGGDAVRDAAVAQLGAAPAPTSRTGRLAGSFVTEQAGQDVVRVGPTAPYARKLEIGDPHPFFKPGVAAAREKIVEAMRQAWAKAHP